MAAVCTGSDPGAVQRANCAGRLRRRSRPKEAKFREGSACADPEPPEKAMVSMIAKAKRGNHRHSERTRDCRGKCSICSSGIDR